MGLFRGIAWLVIGAVEAIVNAVHRTRQRRRLEKALKKLEKAKNLNERTVALKEFKDVKNQQKEISK